MLLHIDTDFDMRKQVVRGDMSSVIQDRHYSVQLRAGIDAGSWSVAACSQNLTNNLYHAEFLPASFGWRALRCRRGVDVEYHF